MLPPVYRFRPWQAAMAIFGLTWGATTAIRVLIERHLYFTRWFAFNIGDTVFLPLFAYFTSKSLQGYEETDRFYDKKWWKNSLVGIGAFATIVHQLVAFRLGDQSLEGLKKPSEWWHTSVIVIGLTWLGSSVFQLWNAPKSWAKSLAFLSFAGYIGTWVADYLRPR